MSATTQEKSSEQRFTDALGPGRGSGRPEAASSGTPAHNHSQHSPHDMLRVAADPILELVCLDCGNIPYEDENGWHGHDEDCPSLGGGGHAVPNLCSDCGKPIFFSDNGYVGHRSNCSQPTAAPDIYSWLADNEREV
jgi:hypothetical protein